MLSLVPDFRAEDLLQGSGEVCLCVGEFLVVLGIIQEVIDKLHFDVDLLLDQQVGPLLTEETQTTTGDQHGNQIKLLVAVQPFLVFRFQFRLEGSEEWVLLFSHRITPANVHPTSEP